MIEEWREKKEQVKHEDQKERNEDEDSKEGLSKRSVSALKSIKPFQTTLNDCCKEGKTSGHYEKRQETRDVSQLVFSPAVPRTSDQRVLH